MKYAWRVATPAEIAGGEREEPSTELLRTPIGEAKAPWVLFVGEDERALRRAAARSIAERALEGLVRSVLLPPASVPLPLAVHRLGAPDAEAPIALFLPGLERAFYDTYRSGSFSLATPLYLFPRVTWLAAGSEPIPVVATARESALSSKAPEVIQGRGLAGRFEVRRVPGGARGADEATPAIEELPPPDLLLAEGLATRDPAAREKAFRDAVSGAPDDALALTCLASALLEQGRLEEGVRELRRALEVDPRLDVAHYELGKALIQTDDIEGALAAFQRTTELLPEYGSAWGNLGAALGEMRRRDEATRALLRAVALDPSSHAFYSNLGVSLREQGRFEEADAAFREALRLAPDFPFGYYNLAQNDYLRGRYEEAIALFEKARSLDRSRSPRQSLLLAAARLAAGDVEGAHKEYEEVFRRLEGRMKQDMKAVAEWDLEQLARSRGEDSSLAETLALVRRLA